MWSKQNAPKEKKDSKDSLVRLLLKTPYTFKDAEGNVVTAILDMRQNNEYRIDITSESNKEVKCYIIYTANKASSEIYLHEILANPQGSGLGGLLLYLLALQTQAEGYDKIRALLAAADVRKFYIAMKFTEDPDQEKVPITFQNESTGEKNTLLTTPELIASAKAIIEKYNSNPRWMTQKQFDIRSRAPKQNS